MQLAVQLALQLLVQLAFLPGRSSGIGARERAGSSKSNYISRCIRVHHGKGRYDASYSTSASRRATTVLTASSLAQSCLASRRFTFGRNPADRLTYFGESFIRLVNDRCQMDRPSTPCLYDCCEDSLILQVALSRDLFFSLIESRIGH